jgi:hypothetical protein
MGEFSLKEIDRKIALLQAEYRNAKFQPRERIRLHNAIERLRVARANRIGRKP